MDWEDIRFFAALARHGSLSAAARALRVNHATVARRVSSLERDLGKTLFERRPTGYELTRDGQEVLDAAGAMEQAAARLGRGGGAGPASISGLVRVAATPSLAEAFLVSSLTPLLAGYPDLDIEVVADRRSVSLARHEADVALRLSRPKDGDLMARRVATFGFGIFGTREWRERLKEGAPPLFCGFDEASAHLPEAIWLRRRYPEARLVMRSNSQTSQAAAARAGQGIAVLPGFIAAGDHVLVPIPLGEEPPPRDLWLLTRRDVATVPPIRAVADFLAALFRDRRGLFAGDDRRSASGRAP